MVKTCSKRLPAKLEELNNVLAFTEAELEAAGCPMKEQMAISVCLEEAFVNVASYAYPEDYVDEEIADLTVSIDEEKRTVTLEISDNGIPFDPLAKQDPDVSLPADERKIGGLGIFMVKKMMDQVDYKYRDGKNILTMCKNF